MSHVLVFLTIHGLGTPVGWILPSGALLYGLRLDQIVRFPMIFQLGMCVIAMSICKQENQPSVSTVLIQTKLIHQSGSV